jgi:hypothetical protein
MPVYKFQLTNGKTLKLEGDTQPSDADAEQAAAAAGVSLASADAGNGQVPGNSPADTAALLKPNAESQQALQDAFDPVTRFAKGAVTGAKNALTGLGTVLTTNPVDTVKAAWEAQMKPWERAGAAYATGHTADAAIDAVNGLVPGVGPWVSELAHKAADTGDWAGAAGEAAGGTIVGEKTGAAALKAAPIALRVVPKAVAAVPGALRGAAGVVADNPSIARAVAGGAGYALHGPFGAAGTFAAEQAVEPWITKTAAKLSLTPDDIVNSGYIRPYEAVGSPGAILKNLAAEHANDPAVAATAQMSAGDIALKVRQRLATVAADKLENMRRGAQSDSAFLDKFDAAGYEYHGPGDIRQNGVGIGQGGVPTPNLPSVAPLMPDAATMPAGSSSALSDEDLAAARAARHTQHRQIGGQARQLSNGNADMADALKTAGENAVDRGQDPFQAMKAAKNVYIRGDVIDDAPVPDESTPNLVGRHPDTGQFTALEDMPGAPTPDRVTLNPLAVVSGEPAITGMPVKSAISSLMDSPAFQKLKGFATSEDGSARLPADRIGSKNGPLGIADALNDRQAAINKALAEPPKQPIAEWTRQQAAANAPSKPVILESKNVPTFRSVAEPWLAKMSLMGEKGITPTQEFIDEGQTVLDSYTSPSEADKIQRNQLVGRVKQGRKLLAAAKAAVED